MTNSVWWLDALLEISITLLTPFVVYLCAEALHMSGGHVRWAVSQPAVGALFLIHDPLQANFVARRMLRLGDRAEIGCVYSESSKDGSGA